MSVGITRRPTTPCTRDKAQPLHETLNCLDRRTVRTNLLLPPRGRPNHLARSRPRPHVVGRRRSGEPRRLGHHRHPTCACRRRPNIPQCRRALHPAWQSYRPAERHNPSQQVHRPVFASAFATTGVTSSLFLTALAPNAAALAIAKENRQCRGRLVAMVHRFRAARHPVALILVPLLSYVVCRPEVKREPGDRRVERATNSPRWARRRAANGSMAALVLLAMFLWICGSNQPSACRVLGSNFINPTMVVLLS